MSTGSSEMRLLPGKQFLLRHTLRKSLKFQTIAKCSVRMIQVTVLVIMSLTGEIFKDATRDSRVILKI